MKRAQKLILHRRLGSAARLAGALLTLAGLWAVLPPAFGQTSAPLPTQPTTAKTTRSHPTWKELSEPQRVALQPLAAHWDTLPQERKRKWLAMSQNYYAMPPAEQAKLQSRMHEWVQLSRQQRIQARQNYAETKKLTPEQKSAQWQAYQQLSPEERRRLAAKANSKLPGVASAQLSGAEKLPHLATKRAVRRDPATGTAAATTQTAASPIHRDTLLPRHPEPVAEHIERVEHIERPDRPERPDVPGRGY